MTFEFVPKEYHSKFFRTVFFKRFFFKQTKTFRETKKFDFLSDRIQKIEKFRQSCLHVYGRQDWKKIVKKWLNIIGVKRNCQLKTKLLKSWHSVPLLKSKVSLKTQIKLIQNHLRVKITTFIFFLWRVVLGGRSGNIKKMRTHQRTWNLTKLCLKDWKTKMWGKKNSNGTSKLHQLSYSGNLP